MKRLNKRSVFTVVLALMLTLSIGFYTGLRPTTAWFHQEDSVTKTYDVGTFDVDFDATVHANMNLTFDVTTKLSEALETTATDAATRNKEFEYAVKYLYVTIANNVEASRTDADYLDALVKLNVGEAETEDSSDSGSGSGSADSGASALRFYYFPLTGSDTQYSSVTTDNDGTTASLDLAAKLQTYCSANNIADDDDFIDPTVNPQMAFDDLEDDADAGLIRVAHNESVTVCVAIWVDHGDSGVTNTTFPITVSMSARQALAE